MVCKSSIFLLCLVGLSSGLAAQTSDISKQDFVSMLEACEAYGESIAPYEFVGNTVESDRFGEEVVETRTVSFRIRYAPEQEEFVWAIDRKLDNRLTGEKSERVHALFIQGSTIKVGSSGGGRDDKRFSSFADAVRESERPTLAYWTLFEFPFFEPGAVKFKKEVGNIHQVGNTVHSENVDGGRKFTAKIRWTEDHSTIYSWVVVNDGFRVSSLAVGSSFRDEPVSYNTQTNTWEDFRGRLVPKIIAGDRIMARPREGSDIWEPGVQTRDTQLEWMHVDELPPLGAIKEKLSSVIGIRKYISEGQLVAKRENE